MSSPTSMTRSERGSAVAEFAVAMPAVLLVLATALGGLQLAGLQLRAQDAAADAARSYARGDPGGVVTARLARQLPGAGLTRFGRADLVCVRITAAPTGPIARLGIRVSASSCAMDGGR
jgi:hypothetical protein